MTLERGWARGHLWLAVIAAAGVMSIGEPARSQQTTFRASASAVMVDVSVRDRSRRAIRDLTASDFEVFDNGVSQPIAQVSFGQLPIDVTVALDVSYSVTGTLLDSLRRAVVQLMDDLGPDDRLKLVLFNMRVNRIVDFTRDVKVVEDAIRAATAAGGTALYDAVGVALVSASTPDRRQLVVFFSDGSDTVSATTPAMLTNVAQRTRATLTFVNAGSDSVVVNPTTGGRVIVRGTPVPRVLTELATETGGSVLQVNRSSNLTSTFRRILSDFRSAYVLYYNAQGVDLGGYHAIEVRVNREDAIVTARRGYFGS